MVKRLRRRPLTAKTGVRVPMEVPDPLPGFDAVLVGDFFTPSGSKAPAARGGMGRFTESYGSDSASLYRKPGADGQTGLFRDQNRIRMNCGYIPTIVRYGIAICIADLEAKSLYHRKLER